MLNEEIWNIVEQYKIDEETKELFEQYYTPKCVAEYMSKFFKESKNKTIKILDPGAGIGILTIAFVFEAMKWKKTPRNIEATLYEIDMKVKPTIEHILNEVKKITAKSDIEFKWEVKYQDFLCDGVDKMSHCKSREYDYIILNPPYKKMKKGTEIANKLKENGIESANYYSAFISICMRMLKKKGEIVAITPRSFCNGSYFKKFRLDIIDKVRFSNFHLFESRKSAFKKDAVLQETIIYHLVKDEWKENAKVKIYHSTDETLADKSVKVKKLEDIIYPSDYEKIIRLEKNESDSLIANKIERLPCTLEELNINVSTGPVVDFREKEGALGNCFELGDIPYICSGHINRNRIFWPSEKAKYNVIKENKKNTNKLRVMGNYVLVRRISSKEENRRIVVSVIESDQFSSERITFDNKINYYHTNKRGLDSDIAMGLYVYLHSSIVDIYFRIFSGSTQVNAGDLKNIKYPSTKMLKLLGADKRILDKNQKQIDKLVEEVIFHSL